mmetsp:Transcript_23762/g.60056  ORF Transcript_23762/g.60056 Transcript_23762/m.60056 type:complete len:112 (+) Transcript_23762:2691-3026(+)
MRGMAEAIEQYDESERQYLFDRAAVEPGQDGPGRSAMMKQGGRHFLEKSRRAANTNARREMETESQRSDDVWQSDVRKCLTAFAEILQPQKIKYCSFSRSSPQRSLNKMGL